MGRERLLSRLISIPNRRRRISMATLFLIIFSDGITVGVGGGDAALGLLAFVTGVLFPFGMDGFLGVFFTTVFFFADLGFDVDGFLRGASFFAASLEAFFSTMAALSCFCFAAT